MENSYVVRLEALSENDRTVLGEIHETLERTFTRAPKSDTYSYEILSIIKSLEEILCIDKKILSMPCLTDDMFA